MIGTEEVVIGTEDVVVGTEDIVIGSETVVIGSEDYVTGTHDVLTGVRQVSEGTKQVDTGILDSMLIGFSTAARADGAETASAKSRSKVLESVLALETAIGARRADNPFAEFATSLGLDDLERLSTREQRDRALTKVRTALQALGKSIVPLATLLQANIAIGQGATLAAQAAYARTPASVSRLGVLA